ncbi:cobalt ECF transporter T component CbiQ [uncultured Metabacillus sp.]|uniref:cobalt ECF transporter T component CbiQ n=1 Tax=uncultured Metabacillus sp. TaxID=2860135 RepID=UPI0026158236|nr:cobalt ECF transporter T component CbiQ [uncultured Metabacillus sp.]
MLKIDDYAYSNRLKHVHPAEKVGFVMTFLMFTIITKNVVIAMITFSVMSLSIVFAAKIPFSQYLKLLLLPSIFLFTSIAAILVSIAPVYQVNVDTIWFFTIKSWQIYISVANINQAYQLLVTIIGSVSCLYFLILTTPLHQLIWVLRRLKLPVLFIELVGLTYRFIFVLLNKMHEIHLAQSSRLGYQNHRLWISSIAHLIVSLFLKSIQSAKELQIAIDSRGGDMKLYEVELSLSYNRYRCAGILVSIIGLFILTLNT